MVDATQTVLTVGMPTLAVLVGILINNSRLGDLRAYIDSRFADAEKVNEAHFKMLLGKVEDIDNRMTRLEERFAR